MTFQEAKDKYKLKYDSILVCDFESVTLEDAKHQTKTDVWLSSSTELWSEEEYSANNILSQLYYLMSKGKKVLAYWHNLRFDGEFLVHYLITQKGFKNAIGPDGQFLQDYQLRPKMIKYLISEGGLWYCIKIKFGGTLIEIWDSLKSIPHSVQQISEDFNTKYKKLNIEYVGERRPYRLVKEDEKRYGLNDCHVVREALEELYEMGLNSMTIGSSCYKEFESGFTKEEYNELFPNLMEVSLDKEIFGRDNQWEFCHDAYFGGWVFNKEKERTIRTKSFTKKIDNKEIKYSGISIDNNGSYSAQMHSSSGQKFPVGVGTPFVDKIPKEAFDDDKYFIVKVRVQFDLKEGYLPTVCVRNNLLYNSREWLKTSDVLKDGKYHKFVEEINGNIRPAYIDLTLTQTDLEMFIKHYKVRKGCFKVICGLYFDAKIGLFDKYIDKWQKIKAESKGAKRSIAKLALNNLAGKFASVPKANLRVFEGVNEAGVLKYGEDIKSSKKPGYIPVAAATTAYGRKSTISVAQANYDAFLYSDTDSGKFECAIEDIKGVEIDQKKLGAWKVEAYWDEARFVKSKTYIEHIIADGNGEVDSHYKVTCAGLPERSKALFILSMLKYKPDAEDIKLNKYTQEHLDFINKEYTIDDFTYGLTVPGKLMPRRVNGGIVLVEETFTIQ